MRIVLPNLGGAGIGSRRESDACGCCLTSVVEVLHQIRFGKQNCGLIDAELIGNLRMGQIPRIRSACVGQVCQVPCGSISNSKGVGTGSFTIKGSQIDFRISGRQANAGPEFYQDTI